jgi:pimeloyl-ACP methyl ester carboxylesterase
MTASDLDCANYCAACYSSPAQFDAVFSGAATEEVWVGVKSLDDCCVVAFRGSVSFLDWQRDLDSIMIADSYLGGVEQGFMEGMLDTFKKLSAVTLPDKNPLIITGHSLGAARALIYAAMMAGVRKVANVVTFGSPRPGAEKLKYLLSGVTINSYRNRHDPVTNVPFDFPGMPYVHPRDLIAVDAPPRLPDSWGLLADHHIALYVQAMQLQEAKNAKPAS